MPSKHFRQEQICMREKKESDLSASIEEKKKKIEI
jgi:hypothetical protein